MSNTIKFILNGRVIELKNPDIRLSLNEWLRLQPGLTGTKVMCEEGGCGCCAVALTKNGKTTAVNSCLAPLCSVDGSEIVTVEGIGSRKQGYHPVQKRLHGFFGTQCGYCTPGVVVNMYSALENGNGLTQRQIEDRFDGNLCRCTGYRPILDAMKSFATDAETRLVKKCQDIEDLGFCHNSTKPCSKACLSDGLRKIEIEQGECKYKRVVSLEALSEAMNSAGGNVKLICGNTGSGVFHIDKRAPVEFIDIKGITSLGQIRMDSEFFVIGATVSLQELHDHLVTNQEKCVTFLPAAKHISKVASLPVRNAASWAGNLMLKHQHKWFQSDIFTVFVACGAVLTILDAKTGSTFECDLTGEGSFLQQDMSKKVILSAKFPLIQSCNNVKQSMESYKVMPRSQNAFGYVNAAFRTSIDQQSKTFGDMIIAYGGISSVFTRAYNTEKFLTGKGINDAGVLKGAIKVLLSETEPEQFSVADATCDYKTNVAASLLYRFYLSVSDPTKINASLTSGAFECERRVSTATHSYDFDRNTFPVSQSMPKLSSQLQATGEAYYASDRVPTRDELFACFVPATIANADIEKIDVSTALKMEGCIDIVYRENLPADFKNTYYHVTKTDRPLLATKHTEFAGEPVALVIAESLVQANEIAKAVKVTYKNCQKPILTIDDAIEAKSFFPQDLEPVVIGDPSNAIDEADHEITGELRMGSQYHMYMETHNARVAPTEDGGFEVESSTQVQTWIQRSLSYCFGIPCNKVYVHTKRLGGSFGGKATYSQVTAVAAALGAHVTNRPVRLCLSMQQCMETYGMRCGHRIKYRIGVNEDGILQGLECTGYANLGWTPEGEVDELERISHPEAGYTIPNWKFTPVKCKTNLPSRTMTRAPGHLNTSALMDCVMEHIAFVLKKDPIAIKRINLEETKYSLNGGPSTNLGIREIHDKLLTWADVSNRQKAILEFNARNRWKKKGLAVTPIKYSVLSFWLKHCAMVSIYAVDGTVVITHGGIENGQGINVKTAQVAAYTLNIPIDKVSVHQTSTLTAPNNGPTGGSVASDVNCKAVIKCCEILSSRIRPIREAMDKDASWASIIAKCDASGVDLCAEAMIQPDHSTTYDTFGATATEVELDVLTGQYQIRRVDLIYDCGVSMNPEIDIGQTEGAFVFGLGYWLSEKLVYDPKTGQLLTNRTWNYKIPTSKDIPEVWNIEPWHWFSIH